MIADLEKRIQANTAAKDKTIAKFRVEQAKLTAELDVLVAAEKAAAAVAGMSTAERQAILTELGGN